MNSNRSNIKRPTVRHIPVKMFKVKDKQMILKAERRKMVFHLQRNPNKINS